MRYQLVLVLLGAASCGAGELALECDNVVDPENSYPHAGERDVDLGAQPYVTLARPDRSATLTMTDAFDRQLGGAVLVEGPRLTFVPDQLLTPETDHALTLSYACGSVAVPFRTSSFGQALEVDPTRFVYELDFYGATWVAPVGDAALFSQVVLGAMEVLVTPLDFAAGGSVLGAYGTGSDQQDTCLPTFDLAIDTVDGPWFESHASEIPYRYQSLSSTLNDVVLEGTFSPDGEELLGSLTAQIDTRPLIALLPGEVNDDELCHRAAKSGATCVACTSDGAERCLDVLLEPLRGYRVHTHLVEVEKPAPECSE